MANLDTALTEQVFDFPERQRESDVEHDRQADDLGRCFEVAEGEALGHPQTLSSCLHHLKSICTDSAPPCLTGSIPCSRTIASSSPTTTGISMPSSISSTASAANTAIEHKLTKVKHPWTNGQVERMNRTIKDATVKRFHYEDHDQMRQHLANLISAYNFGRRLKTLKGLTPYEFICKCWTLQPERFILDRIHHMPGLNT